MIHIPCPYFYTLSLRSNPAGVCDYSITQGLLSHFYRRSRRHLPARWVLLLMKGASVTPPRQVGPPVDDQGDLLTFPPGGSFC